jgi:recombination protein RecT
MANNAVQLVNQMKVDIGKMKPEFAKTLPGHITPDSFVRTAQTAVSLTRNIEKVKDFRSLMAACSKAAADGLVLDGREAALVIDYKGEVQYRPMMQGLLKLAWQSDQIKGMVIEVVRKGDFFDRSPTNLTQPITHKIDYEKERGDIYVVYGLAELKTGGIIHEVMTVDEINKIRDRSDGWKAFQAGKIKSTPWATDWSEMSRKTIFRRMRKYLPASSHDNRFAQAAERIDDDFTFDADADVSTGKVTNIRPAGKKRGAGAEALKNITPKQQQAKPANDDQGAPHVQDYDPDTGEVHDGEYVSDFEAFDAEVLPGDDI